MADMLRPRSNCLSLAGGVGEAAASCVPPALLWFSETTVPSDMRGPGCLSFGWMRERRRRGKGEEAEEERKRGMKERKIRKRETDTRQLRAGTGMSSLGLGGGCHLLCFPTRSGVTPAGSWLWNLRG